MYLHFPPTEARDALKSTKLVKSLKVKREKVSSMSPEVQHQVGKYSVGKHLAALFGVCKDLMLTCVLSGLAERFGDIRPDGESGRSHRRDLRGETEAVRLKPSAFNQQLTTEFILKTVFHFKI